MGRSKYKIIENGKTYFITSSVINWLSLFALPAPAGIVIYSLNFVQQQQRVKIHAWVLMETHFHLVATSANISSEMRKIKSYTARCIVDYLKANGPKFLLEQLKFYKKSIKMIKSIRKWAWSSLLLTLTDIILFFPYLIFNFSATFFSLETL